MIWVTSLEEIYQITCCFLWSHWRLYSYYWHMQWPINTLWCVILVELHFKWQMRQDGSIISDAKMCFPFGYRSLGCGYFLPPEFQSNSKPLSMFQITLEQRLNNIWPPTLMTTHDQWLGNHHASWTNHFLRQNLPESFDETVLMAKWCHNDFIWLFELLQTKSLQWSKVPVSLHQLLCCGS